MGYVSLPEGNSSKPFAGSLLREHVIFHPSIHGFQTWAPAYTSESISTS